MNPLEEIIESVKTYIDNKFSDVRDSLLGYIRDAISALPIPKDGNDGSSVGIDEVLPHLIKHIDEKLEKLELPQPEKIDYDRIDKMVAEKIDAIPAPKEIKIDDFESLISEKVALAVSNISVPAPDEVDYEIIKTHLSELVEREVAKIPPAKDGIDACHIAPIPFIDEKQSYPRGEWAIHNGGLWRSFEKTHGMRGWECVVNGVASHAIEQHSARGFTIKTILSDNTEVSKVFSMPITKYCGVYKAGTEYERGDFVTFAGSVWHCDESTSEKPGTGSNNWTLSVKRGADGRDKS